eukprot:CAMPEP_0204381568 /NCGR_PEP_ID=MMETSP0469-20131031/54345_1 /ASSEMBLY_ACC=CAM_ASM_000384 /TAXON_ID=2969 /ORGANISM="Oxyrrhis marina" /LENGTH=57 /DNA_ID=CAMNT_0051373439 /DNA_START=74 /DNA_END=244 /DNA_ORIENTATION=-
MNSLQLAESSVGASCLEGSLRQAPRVFPASEGHADRVSASQAWEARTAGSTVSSKAL